MTKDKKTILWVTPDCFLDCDIILMPSLAKSFKIHWIVILPAESRYQEKDFVGMQQHYDNLTIEVVKKKLGAKDRGGLVTNIKLALTFLKDNIHLAKQIRDFKADACYLNISPTPWTIVMLPYIKAAGTVVTAHQGRVHLGMSHKRMTKLMRWLWYGHFKTVNMFSKSQAALFRQDFKKSKVYQFVLGLKEFGTATNERPNEGDVRFLSFGTLNYAKNIDLLIDAACLLYERGVRGFKVSIAGMCKDWSWYQQRIKYPEIFELDIRMIDNSEIPNLFNGSHYLVQPYRVVSQSGPTKIAFNYNLPVIASNLPGFMDEIEEGVNGYSFEIGNVESLADRMQQLIENHKTGYAALTERMKAYTEEHYAVEALAEQYKNMIEEVMMKNEMKYKQPFSIVEWLKKSKTLLFVRLMAERVQELRLATRYLASGNRYQDARKLRTDLQIRVHSIEKGMSIGRLKDGFGNKKACDIVDDLRGYVLIGGERQFVVESCSVLQQYVKFKEEIGQDANDVKAKLEGLMTDCNIKPLEQGGIYRLHYEDIQKKANGNLEEVMASRYAVRDFGSTPIDMGMLRKALQMAEKSPSACNRQSWRIHVYRGEKAMRMFNLQGG